MVDEPIVHNYGKIRIDDSMWKINGSDPVVGLKFKVVSLEGTVFKVEQYKY